MEYHETHAARLKRKTKYRFDKRVSERERCKKENFRGCPKKYIFPHTN